MQFKNIKNFTSGGKSLTKIYHSGGVVWEKDCGVKINSGNISFVETSALEISDLDLKQYGGIRKFQISFNELIAKQYGLRNASYIWVVNLDYVKINATEQNTKGNIITLSFNDKIHRIERIWIAFDGNIDKIPIEKFDVRYKIIE